MSSTEALKLLSQLTQIERAKKAEEEKISRKFQKRIEDLEEENETLKEENETLKEENETLKEENETLKEEIETLKEKKSSEDPLPDNPYGANNGIIKCSKCGKVQSSGWQHCVGCGWNWGYHSDTD